MIADLKSSGVQVDVVDLNYDVIVRRNVRHLLRNINLHLDAGEMYALMGPSGKALSTHFFMSSHSLMHALTLIRVQFTNVRLQNPYKMLECLLPSHHRCRQKHTSRSVGKAQNDRHLVRGDPDQSAPNG